MKNSAFREVKN